MNPYKFGTERNPAWLRILAPSGRITGKKVDLSPPEALNSR
jgi:hypothetical protein